LYQWKAETFTVERPVMQLNPSVTVSSLGASFTGFHASTTIADDIETSDNCLTADQREKNKQRIAEFGKLSKQILMFGTPHHEQSIYLHLQDIGYLEKKIPVIRTRTVKQEDSTDKVENYLAWPDHPEEMFSYNWLDQQKRETTEGDFNSQYMLIPQTTYQPLIDLDKINYYEEELEWSSISQPFGNYITACRLGKRNITRLVGAWDVASGLKNRDQSVLSICARDEDGNTFVHDLKVLSAVDEATKDFKIQCREVILACAYHKLSHIIVEENFSATLAAELRRTAKEMKVFVNIVPRFRTTNKKVFIAQTIEPIIKVGRLYVHKKVDKDTPFMDELQAFPRNKKDDCIDATCEAINYLPNIAVDVSKVGKIYNPLNNAGSSFKIN